MSDANLYNEKLPASIEERISHAQRGDDISEIIKQYWVEQGRLTRDNDPSILHEVLTPQPRSFAKTIIVNGEKHVIEAATEAGLQQAELDFFRTQFQPQEQQTQPTPQRQTTQPRGDDGRFVSTEEQAEIEQSAIAAANRTDLELRFKRGEISTEDYLAASGAVENHLKNVYGVDPSALARIGEQQFVQDWQSATAAFVQNHQDWIGGAKNTEILGELMLKAGYDDTPDKLAALESAYQFAVEHDLLVSNPELDYQAELSEAVSREDVDRIHQKYASALGVRTNAGGSNFWGR